MRVLVINPGSATLKVALVVDGEAAESANVSISRFDTEVHAVIARWSPVDAVGVRFVHGGHDLVAPTLIDDEAYAVLEGVTNLAPLHNPSALAATRAVRAAYPDLPVVACFDTAFHSSMPPEAYTYALPKEWNARWGLRRYGFHGLSHEYAAAHAAEMIGRPLAGLRIVTCHLGGGASLCAVAGGRSVDTTMGFTPMAGLVMQVRSGSVDPGLLLWLLTEGGLSTEELYEGLERNAGLKGLTDTSGDMREVVAGAEAGDAGCVLALEVYLHRLVREIGAMVASLGGLDVLVFTGGVGEHQQVVRQRAAEGLGYLGVAVEADLNVDEEGGDRVLTAAGSTAAVLVVESREDLQIVAGVERVLG